MYPVGDLDYWINKVTILFESKQAKINACSQFARKLYFIQTNVYFPSTPLPLQKKIKKLRPHLPTKTINLSLITIHINAAILKSLWLNCGIYIKNKEIHFIEMGLKNVTKKIKKLSTHCKRKISTWENYF